MTDLNNCFSCIHYGDDEGICTNHPGADEYPEPVENPEEEKSCFVLEPWIAVERLTKAEEKITTLQQIIELQDKAIDSFLKLEDVIDIVADHYLKFEEEACVVGAQLGPEIREQIQSFWEAHHTYDQYKTSTKQQTDEMKKGLK